MPDYIDRDVLCRKISNDKTHNNKHDTIEELVSVLKHINNAPSVNAVEVVHGHWENIIEENGFDPKLCITFTHTYQTCSCCHRRIGFVGVKKYIFDSNCPSCGSIMLQEDKQ